MLAKEMRLRFIVSVVRSEGRREGNGKGGIWYNGRTKERNEDKGTLDIIREYAISINYYYSIRQSYKTKAISLIKASAHQCRS